MFTSCLVNTSLVAMKPENSKIQRKDLSNITARIKAITTFFFPKMLFSYLAYSWPSSKWFKYFGGIIQLLVRKTKKNFFLFNA